VDPLRNPNDPLLGSGPDLGLELFRRLEAAANGMPCDVVINATTNLFINSIRQAAPDWRRAESAFDEIFGRAKQILKDHYDAAGRKKGIFPYDQGIFPELLIGKSKSH
jgi:hypothetical protein